MTTKKSLKLQDKVPLNLGPSSDLTENGVETKLEFKRFFILIAFSIYAFNAAIAWLTYTPVLKASTEYFNCTESEILEFGDLILYAFFLFAIPMSYLSYKRFKNTLLFCMLMECLGGWIRYFAGDNYKLSLFGQALIAINTSPVFAQSFIISDRWFSTKETFVVQTIALFSNYIGWGLGYMIPSVIVGDDPTLMHANEQFQAWLFSVPFIIGVFCIADRPATPPSYSAYVKMNDKLGFLEEIKKLLKIKKFNLMAILFGSSIAVSFAVTGALAKILEHLNMSEWHKGSIGTVYVISGLVTIFSSTIYVSKSSSQNYDKYTKIIMSIGLGSVILTGLLLALVHPTNIYIYYGLSILLGAGLIAIPGFVTASIVEITFPVQEAISVMALFAGANLLAVLWTRVGVDMPFGDWSFLVLALGVFPSWYYAFFHLKTEYKKSNAEKSHKNEVLTYDGVDGVNEDIGGHSSPKEIAYESPDKLSSKSESTSQFEGNVSNSKEYLSLGY